jgi:hypothetical protein
MNNVVPNGEFQARRAQQEEIDACMRRHPAGSMLLGFTVQPVPSEDIAKVIPISFLKRKAKK